LPPAVKRGKRESLCAPGFPVPIFARTNGCFMTDFANRALLPDLPASPGLVYSGEAN